MMRCFEINGNINRINFCMAAIEIHSYFSLISHFDQFNILKNILYIKKSAIGQQIISSKNVKSQKKSLVTVILNIRLGQVTKQLCNTT